MRASCCIVCAIALLLTPVHTGCQWCARSVIDGVYPKGSSGEPGISKREQRARFEQEYINAVTGVPLSSENR